MSKDELQAFFDLGNSTKRKEKDLIGEKGHGTKVYLNSSKIVVSTGTKEGISYMATMTEPSKNLHQRRLPEVEVATSEGAFGGTEITIYGYNNNRRDNTERQATLLS